MSNDDSKKYSVHQCCDVKEYLGVNGLNTGGGSSQNAYFMCPGARKCTQQLGSLQVGISNLGFFASCALNLLLHNYFYFHATINLIGFFFCRRWALSLDNWMLLSQNG